MNAIRTTLAILVLLCSSTTATAADAQFQAERARLRQMREKLREDARADRVARARHAADAIAALIDAAGEQRVAGQRATLRQMLRGLQRLDPSLAPALAARVDALGEAPAERDRQAERRWRQAHERTLRKLLTRPGELLNRSIDAGVNDLAYDFLQEILAFDPDRAPLRRQLGQTLVDGRWLDPYDAAMAQKGLVWDPRFAWIRAGERSRYEGGEYFDLATQRWVPLAQANAAHARLGDPWVIRTAHLEVRGHADLEVLATAATRLEAFYRQIFAAYSAFFTKTKADYKLILGLAEHEPLVVTIYRDQEQYRKARPQSPEWSAGVFSSRDGGSFFFGSIDEVMYHEFTHQILHVFTGGNASPSWLTEGIAVYTETPVFDDDGTMRLGDLAANRDVREHLRAFRNGTHLPLDRLLALRTYEDWVATKTPGPQYDAAGALVQFCMEGDGRAYRADFVDFLRDSYNRQAEHPLWSYLGLDRAAFEERYEAWQRRGGRDAEAPD